MSQNTSVIESIKEALTSLVQTRLSLSALALNLKEEGEDFALAADDLLNTAQDLYDIEDELGSAIKNYIVAVATEIQVMN